MILRPLFCFEDTKNTGLLIKKEKKKSIFNFLVNRNWKKLTDSRKRAKILADNRKSHHPIETLLLWLFSLKEPSLDKIEETFNILIMKFFPPLRRSRTNPYTVIARFPAKI